MLPICQPCVCWFLVEFITVHVRSITFHMLILSPGNQIHSSSLVSPANLVILQVIFLSALLQWCTYRFQWAENGKCRNLQFFQLYEIGSTTMNTQSEMEEFGDKPSNHGWCVPYRSPVTRATLPLHICLTYVVAYQSRRLLCAQRKLFHLSKDDLSMEDRGVMHIDPLYTRHISGLLSNTVHTGPPYHFINAIWQHGNNGSSTRCIAIRYCLSMAEWQAACSKHHTSLSHALFFFICNAHLASLQALSARKISSDYSQHDKEPDKTNPHLHIIYNICRPGSGHNPKEPGLICCQ